MGSGQRRLRQPEAARKNGQKRFLAALFKKARAFGPGRSCPIPVETQARIIGRSGATLETLTMAIDSPKKPFSKRYGYRSPKEITVWEDAPESLRHFVLDTAVELGFGPYPLRD